MTTASEFIADLRGPLEIRQEIGESISILPQTAPKSYFKNYLELEHRIDAVVQDFWTQTMLSLTEEIGETQRRPLQERDIPAVAASMCIQFLMSDTFPEFRKSQARSLLDGNRANPIYGESTDIEQIETNTIGWLQSALELGERAESGKPTIASDSKQILHITRRPRIQVQTLHRDGQFHETKTSIDLGVSQTASRRKGITIPNFEFNYSPQTKTDIKSMIPMRNISGPYEKKARKILEKIRSFSKPINIDELFVLTIAKQTGLVKRLPKEPVKVELAQNRKLFTLDAKSFKQLREAANRAGITFCLTHPVPNPRTRINGRTV